MPIANRTSPATACAWSSTPSGPTTDAPRLTRRSANASSAARSAAAEERIGEVGLFALRDVTRVDALLAAVARVVVRAGLHAVGRDDPALAFLSLPTRARVLVGNYRRAIPVRANLAGVATGCAFQGGIAANGARAEV